MVVCCFAASFMLTIVHAVCRKFALDAKCDYAECCYAECLYAECRYAECRGATTDAFRSF